MEFNLTKKIIKENNFDLIHINTTSSTMNDAKKYFDKNEINAVIIADEQTRGRGRLGNKWVSNKGNLFCSIVMKVDIPINEYYVFNIISAVSIKSAIESFGIRNIQFKWPNDIYYKNKKLGGIILESYNSDKKNKYVIIGLGVNFSSSPNFDKYQTTHLKKFVEIKNRFIFYNSFLNYFFYNLNNIKRIKKNIFKEYVNSLMFLNSNIEIISNDKSSMNGIFVGINEDGSLILKHDEKLYSIYSGYIKL